MRLNSSVPCQPMALPVYLRIHGRKRSPSFRKKKVTTSMTNSAVKNDVAKETPVITPDAIREDWPFKKSRPSLITCCSWEVSTSNGRSSIMDGSWRMPSSACWSRSEPWLRTTGAMAENRPAAMRKAPRMVVSAASARGNL